MRPAPPAGPVLVAGLGRAGRAALDALRARGIGPRRAWDSAVAPRLPGVTVAGGDGLGLLDGAALVVKSPGIAFDVPLLAEAARRGVEVIDELELGWRLHASARVAGVTGTNGKSTTTQLVRAVLGDAELAGNTEFGPPLSAVRGGGWIACEVSSYQLEGAPSFRPRVAVFTNLTPDHLDRHGTMAAYGAAKARMFVGEDGSCAGVSVINADDAFGRSLAAAVRRAGGAVLTYGTTADADVRIVEATWTISSATTRLRGRGGEAVLRTRLPGAHNAHNVAAAVAVGEALGIGGVAEALSAAEPPPGRWQLVDPGGAVEVVVDYAHTPDGLRRLLEAVRAGLAPGACLLVVFGPVGVRDVTKDRDSGRWIGALADRLLLTTGSAGIPGRVARMADVRAGASGCPVEVVLDRRAAIARALATARAGDAVVLAGLGHLRRQLLDAHTRHPHNDADAARALLRAGVPAWS